MIVHLLIDEKFTSEFISLVDQEFNKLKKEHVFLIVTKHEVLRYEIKADVSKTFIRQDLKSLYILIRYLLKANRIIVHGLFNPYLIYLLWVTGVANKTIWAIWGGDLYDYNKEKGFFKYVKRSLIRKLQGVTTPVDGDAQLARDIYGFKGKYYPSMMYLSNVVNVTKDDNTFDNPHSQYTILIGNSADSSNRHDYILNKIEDLNLNCTRLILPLSYGSQAYADKVEEKYKSIYGNHAVCLRMFMPKEEYLKLLSEVDVVLFAHNRQQGVGNLMQLINLGAKVYLEPHVTTYSWLKAKGVEVFDFETLNSDIMEPLSIDQKRNNRRIIRSFANRDELVKSLKNIFDGINM